MEARSTIRNCKPQVEGHVQTELIRELSEAQRLLGDNLTYFGDLKLVDKWAKEAAKQLDDELMNTLMNGKIGVIDGFRFYKSKR